MNLENQQIKNTYTGVLNIGATGMSDICAEVTDGDGNNLGIQVCNCCTKFTKANIFAANLPGPYTSDADFYGNYSGATAGQLYLITSGGVTSVTVAGNN